jgi:hypothetical protein
MRNADTLSTWVHVFSLLLPVGPPLGLRMNEQRAFEQLVALL